MLLFVVLMPVSSALARRKPVEQTQVPAVEQRELTPEQRAAIVRQLPEGIFAERQRGEHAGNVDAILVEDALAALESSNVMHE